MPTAQKAQILEKTREKYARAAGVFLTEYRGLTVQQMQALRADLRSKGGEITVIKNTLFKLAIGDDANMLSDDLGSGPTAVAFCYENESEIAKALMEFAKKNKAFVVKGGIIEKAPLDAAQVDALAKLPSKEQLLSMLLGVLQAPVRNLAGTVQAIYANPIRAIGAVADKVAEGSPLPAAAPAAAEEEAPAAAPQEEDASTEVTPAEAETPAEAPTTEETASETTTEE
jgi:large subunit ribosomal protein L10